MLQQLLFLVAATAVLAASDTNYRLNTPIKPKTYNLVIKPYFDTGDENAFTFEGEVTITFTTEVSTNQIKLHSEDLIFAADNITVSTGNNNVQLEDEEALVFVKNYTFAYINLASNLSAGVDHTLKIVYSGPIREDLSGFYRNYYYVDGVKKWLGATQMEPTHARKVFPCFDEPGLKAEFIISIDRPEHYNPSISNMKMLASNPAVNGYVRETFHPTPIMPTYLVAFAVSEFIAARSYVNGTKEFAVYTRPNTGDQSEYAFDFGLRVVDALSDFFGIDYYSTNEYIKLDHIALPDFRAGAMENWGLVTYRESLLLYTPEDSTPYYKYRVAQIVAHETTHMWFGDLVTCHWWSNTWLNEGFANYFQDYITELIEPKVGAGNQLVIGSVYSAYEADDFKTAPPITNNEVNSPAEISGHFGTVTYQKAGSVIRMMHHLIGDDAFKYGLNKYLSDNAFSLGYPELMYSALEEGVALHDSLSSYPSHTLTDVMHSWISRAGHPVVHVDVDYEEKKVTLTQKRFYIDAENESDEIYKIPITYTVGSAADYSNTKPAFIMDNDTYEFTVEEVANHTWILFNLQETGLYRVNYDEHSWQILANVLKGTSSDRTSIHTLNRAKIVNDLFALLYADEVSFELVYDVLEFLSEENEYAVWYAAIRGFSKLRNSFLGSDACSLIEKFEQDHLNAAIEKVGYTIVPNDSIEELRNRMQILEYGCKIGHQGCIDNALALYKAFRENGTEITPSLRPVSYCVGLRYGDGDDYEFLWQRMSTTNVANEASIISNALGCTTDKDKLKKYLVSMKEEDSPIRFQDLTVPLASVLAADYENVKLVLEELDDNYTLWSTVYPSMDSIVSTVAAALHTEEEFKEFENWLSECSECSDQVKESGKKALETARSVTKWAENHKTDIVNSLKNDAFFVNPSMTVICLCVAMTICVFEN